MTDLRDETPAPGQPIRDLSSSEERLLTAATMLFSDRGFEATTTRDISAMAGLSPAAMYVHFSSKEELLFRLVCRAHERALAQVLDAVAPFTDPIDRVRALVRDFSMLHATNFRKARIRAVREPAPPRGAP
ncbi:MULTISPECIES: helix-turn-helix domain-containing protein [Rhodococcus]|uniref:Helix-turn-helix domain-containing protein n=1 Tax=Rhodococcus oxybenzonivorans TaxID=1990687 RepID=A0AAE5A698_9NOCA|nr:MULTISPECIES: helix-turn-helix domain-containing protein [Rhodococcus]MDV7245922.1 helix-turn-helix domain-containing protein [Rhodococcus oxybenzonivorans]MDV7265311.1 helix-turn-helix domain-containing protein [Rhodococcus oxybenzonivorans]MDV7277274.1 helix-turn-helix domain-containing protein [Rhodococcus oxybenzonivorans]MDV7336844.1 helix-turn-helix domain-containing protein [Rhodococcus oxybenzonivorans]MDV7346986.1 helix-turn-helix domain-containing protein [Rhodococcus oxybenzonivo